MIGRSASETMPTAPLTTPNTTSARGNGPCHMPSESRRIPAAVRTPAHGMALVVATSASAALANRSCCWVVDADW